MQPNNPEQQPPAQYGALPQPGQQWPPQYYAPPKRGMPGWAWVLIGCGGLFVVFIIVGILALAAIPLITSNTRDARRAEGEQLMGSMRNHARVAYSKYGQPFDSLADAGITEDDRLGRYYAVNDEIGLEIPIHGEITCTPLESSTDGNGNMLFEWDSSAYQIHWE